MSVRKATHAGGWYPGIPSQLSQDLQTWLDEAIMVDGTARAIISPHAAYQFSGACAAHAYKQVNPAVVKRIFILGPSHYKPITSCFLTKTSIYKTPLYDLQVDVQVNIDLKASGAFEWMDLSVDEKEHSIEMQLPFVAKVMENYSKQFTIVPILVGSMSSLEQEKRYGKIMSKYLADPQNLFVISSDFCHWGKKFSYSPFEYDSGKSIYEYIEDLDRMGIELIEKIDPLGFQSYLKKYRNTICGRNPILILLHAINELKNKNVGDPTIKFLKYTQSNKCLTFKDTSVSYAAAYLTFN